MKTTRNPLGARSLWTRSIAALAGVSIGSLTLGAVIAVFGHASSMPWLAPTPQNVAAVQRCDELPGRAAQHRCIETVVAAVRTRDGSQRLAQSGVDSDPGPHLR